MDLNQLNYLSDEQKERYVKLERTFGTPGWKLIEDWASKNALEAKERATYATTWETNRTALGALYTYQQIAGLREATELEFEHLAEQAKAAQEVEDQDKFE